MKKFTSLLIALALTLSLFAGCAQNTGEPEKSQTEETAAEETIYEADLPTQEEETDIFVKKVDGISDDFIKGVDISSVIAEEESGVKYYDEDGNEEDLFKILADAGVNYVRVRVWNDPYDEDGNGYGGGNCDVEKAGIIGKRAASYGMKLLVDFHYSDFWADPNKQYAPKDWRRKSVEEKQQLLSDYTVESLNSIIAAGADVGMVQIGNEINNGLSSEYDLGDIMSLLDSASKAVRQVDPDIKIIVHYTQIDAVDSIMGCAQNLSDYNIDYDVFGVSYYPYWHGTLENMRDVLTQIKSTYNHDTCVVETAYLFTEDDGDGFGNSVSAGDCIEGYPATVEGQAKMLRDVIAYASDAGSLGVFYWEPAWVPVGSDYDTNKTIWEEYGSGWASSYSASYDPQDAGQYYGGCSWDNQALFGFDGKALPSLNVFKYVNYGATSELKVLEYGEVSIESPIGEELQMPDTVTAYYNDPDCTDGAKVTWNEEDIAAIDVFTAGNYTVTGTTEDGTEIVANVKVANINWVQNPGFEDEDTSMWISSDTAATDIQTKAADALSGEKSFHFWSENNISFTVEQTLEGFNSGHYTAVANIQGGDVGDDAQIYLYVKVNGEVYQSDNITLAGWVQWQTATITDIPVNEGDEVIIGMSVTCAAKGWGTIDDFEFYNQEF